MEATKVKRTTAKGQFTRYENRLKATIDQDDMDSWTMNKRYDDLKERWDKVQDAHYEYVAHLTDSNDIEDADLWIDSLAAKFDEVELRVGKKLKAIKVEQAPSTSTSTIEQGSKIDVHGSQKTVVRVEKMKFPMFEGDIRKYPEFKEDFINHIQPGCEKSQLAFVLKNYLSEPIRDEVNNLSGNYSDMWSRLDQKYGNVGRLMEHILADVKGLSGSGRCESNASVLKMINVVEKAKRDLERLGEEAELHNGTTISIIEQAMTNEMMHEWVKMVASKQLNSRQKFALLMEFLTDWRNRLEYMGASIREDPSLSRSGDAFYAGGNAPPRQRANQGKSTKSRCWVHNVDGRAEDHPVWDCRLFERMPVKERKDLVVANKACSRCLIIGCPGAADAKNCIRLFMCAIPGCNGEHNQLLHVSNGEALHANDAQKNTILPLQES